MSPSLLPGLSGATSLDPGAIDGHVLYRSLFIAYPDSLLLVDASGRIVLANPAAAALLGYTLEEMTGLEVDALVPDGIRPRHASYRKAYLHAPRPRPMGTHVDLVARRKDGSEVMVEIALSPLKDHGLPFVVAAIRDIATYPRVKQALQRARYSDCLAQFGRLAVNARDPQALLDSVPMLASQALQVEHCLVSLLDESGPGFRVTAVVGHVAAEEAGSILPTRADTPAGFVFMQGKPVIVADYRRERRFKVPAAYLEAGLVCSLGVPLTDRGRIIGMIWAASRAPEHFGEEETRFLESLSNLLATSLQRAQSEEALHHSQRLETVGQLTGGIAHDFNNLLTVIQGNLQLLQDLPGSAATTQAQALLSDATRAAMRGAQLTGKLLAFSRRQVLQPVPVDTGAMLRSLANMLRRTLDQRIVIDVDTPAATSTSARAMVLADPSQLESALLNIAINARDAMLEGGSLRFAVAVCTTLPDEIADELQGRSAQDFVALSISDSGSGMSEEVKARAFEPFFTTKEAGRGTGLGLSTVYGFVKQSKGAVTIRSEPGTGTTVTLYIPRPEDERIGIEEGVPEVAELPEGLKVLLVEDAADVRVTLNALLRSLRCDVDVAASAEQALAILGPGPPYDLLITDIALGRGMRGTELASAAQRILPTMAILLMSGFSEELLKADRDSPHEWQLLQKPCSREELARAISQVLSERPGAG